MVIPILMFRDLIFYPVAFAVIAAIIALALSFGNRAQLSDSQILQQGWEISGNDLRELTTSPGSNSAYYAEDGGYVQLSQFTPDGEGPQSIGIFATLGPAHERAFAGRPLQIIFRARSGRINPLLTMDVSYFTMEGPPSGWTTFELTPDWEDYTLNYTPPIIDAPDNVDLIALFPGRTGENKTIDLSSIRVKVVQTE